MDQQQRVRPRLDIKYFRRTKYLTTVIESAIQDSTSWGSHRIVCPRFISAKQPQFNQEWIDGCDGCAWSGSVLHLCLQYVEIAFLSLCALNSNFNYIPSFWAKPTAPHVSEMGTGSFRISPTRPENKGSWVWKIRAKSTHSIRLTMGNWN